MWLGLLAEDGGIRRQLAVQAVKCARPSGSAATLPRRVAFKWVRIPLMLKRKKSLITNVIRLFLAEDEGFEPPRTESESGVLPLH